MYHNFFNQVPTGRHIQVVSNILLLQKNVAVNFFVHTRESLSVEKSRKSEFGVKDCFF